MTTIATGIQNTSYEVDTSLLPGSDNALLQVLASDEVHTVADKSDASFTLGDRSPQVGIMQPSDGPRYYPNEAIVLTGDAYDPEDGHLAGTALTWESDRDGNLGSGLSLILSGEDLAFGEHHITLTATDSDDRTATAAIRLWLGYEVYLPQAEK